MVDPQMQQLPDHLVLNRQVIGVTVGIDAPTLNNSNITHTCQIARLPGGK
jgi:hypothetical protein